MAVILALILSVLWKANPGVEVCALFWLSIVWMTYSMKLASRPAGLLILLGAVSNAVVTVFNGGVMPVIGMPSSFSPLFPVWQRAHASHGLLLLADHASLHYFSMGDLFLIAGTSMLMLTKAYDKFQRAGCVRVIAISHKGFRATASCVAPLGHLATRKVPFTASDSKHRVIAKQ